MDDVFLLTCEDQSQYLVNISTRPVNFLNLPNMVTALANSARYSLIYNNSTATVTIQEVSSQPAAATRTIILNAAVIIYDANFGPDDVFAYIATNRGIVFINVAMALNGAEEFGYIITTQPCSQCPPVIFLKYNTAVITTSISDQFIMLEFFHLWPHSLQWFLCKMLNKQPRWYWFPQLVIPFQPTVFPTTDDFNFLWSSEFVGTVASICISTAIVLIFVYLMIYRKR